MAFGSPSDSCDRCPSDEAREAVVWWIFDGTADWSPTTFIGLCPLHADAGDGLRELRAEGPLSRGELLAWMTLNS